MNAIVKDTDINMNYLTGEKSVVNSGVRELRIEEIEEVNGGIVPVVVYAAAAVGSFGAGYAIGTLINEVVDLFE